MSFEKTDPYGKLVFGIGSGDDFVCFDYGLSDDCREIKLHAVNNSETHSYIEDAEAPTVARLTNAVAEAQRLTDQALAWISGEGVQSPITHDVEGWNQDPQYFVRCVAECVDSIKEDRPANSVTRIEGSNVPPSFVQFTKRTNDPKLAWLEAQLTDAGIAHRRNGESFHAPILDVEESRFDDAWSILTPVDDVPDDDPRYVTSSTLLEDDV